MDTSPLLSSLSSPSPAFSSGPVEADFASLPQFTGIEGRIVDLLAAGVPQVRIAETVGVDASYISQLAGREDISALVSRKRADRVAEKIEHDDSIEGLEKIALERIGKLLPMQSDIMKITRVFQVLNGAKKSGDAAGALAGTVPQQVVVLNLPAAAQLQFKLTSDKQVIEVEGRSMVPMASNVVAAQLRTLKAARLLENAVEMPKAPMISSKTKSIVDQL